MENEIKVKKKSWLNNAILFLIALIAFVFILSIIGSALKWEGTYLKVNVTTGKLENNLVVVQSLFSREGIRYIIGNVLTNFINFTPLVMFLFTMIGIGFADKTGLFQSIFTIFGKRLSRFWITFVVVLLSIISTVIGDIGFVLVVPLAAIMFLANNRNPLVGIIASFAGITSGYGINLFVSQMDYNLMGTTELGAKIIDKTYAVSIYGNLFFGIVSTILMTFLITYITEKFIVKRVNKYKREDLIEEIVIGKKEKKGLLYASIAFVIFLAFFIYMLLPLGTPLAGLLLDYGETTTYGRIFSGNSYVVQGLAFMLCLTLLVCGWLYGIGAKTLKTKNDFSNYLYSSLNNIGGILVLFFFASQLIACFKKTNLGTIFTIWVGNFISNLGFSSIPLILLTFILVAIVNVFQSSSVLKWSILTPFIIPVFMKANITPEFAQAVFRAGDSVTNLITPFFPYFVVFIGMLQLYNKSEEAIGIRDTYKLLLPYLLGIFVFWLILLICWYIINLPIGVGVYPII